MADNQTNVNSTTKDEFDPLVKAGITKTPQESKELIDTTFDSIDTVNDLVNAGPARFMRGVAGRLGKKSIIGMASRNTFEFPVFVSKSVPLDYATATNSLLEQIYASYLQMAVSLNPVIDAKTARGGGPFSNFKTNITKYVEYTDMFYAHDACYAVYQESDYTVEFSLLSITDQDAQLINEAVDYQPMSEFDHFFQEAASKRKRRKTDTSGITKDSLKTVDTTVDTDDVGDMTGTSTKTHSASDEDVEDVKRKVEEHDAKMDEYDARIEQLDAQRRSIEAQMKRDENLSAAQKAKLKKESDYISKEITKIGKEIYKLNLEMDKTSWQRYFELHPDARQRLDYKQEVIDRRLKLFYDAERARNDLRLSNKNVERDQERWDMEKGKYQMDREKHAKDMMVRGPQFLDESKIQKLNTMKPLMMQVQLKVVDKNGGISAPVEYIVGVKTHCRLVDPETLPEVVEYPLKKMDKLTRKAKWRAGEIKFLEYLFGIKEKKQTAIDAKNPKRKWYRRLYELAHKKGDANVAARISGSGNSGLIPNATIMISQTDVDNIKASTGINLLNGSSARKLCNEMFLMAFIVTDFDAESIKILLPDINNDYEVHSLASVKKQLATLDTSGDKARDMFKLLGK